MAHVCRKQALSQFFLNQISQRARSISKSSKSPLLFVFLGSFLLAGCAEEDDEIPRLMLESSEQLEEHLTENYDFTLLIVTENEEKKVGAQFSHTGIRPIEVTEMAEGLRLDILGAYYDMPGVEFFYESDENFTYHLDIANDSMGNFSEMDHQLNSDYRFDFYRTDETEAEISEMHSFEVIGEDG